MIHLESTHGCPVFSTTAWISFLAQHPYILGSLLLVFGALVTFFGRKFFQYTIAATGAALGFLTTMLLFSIMGMLDGLKEEEDGVFLTVMSFVVALIVSVFLGFVMYKTIKFGAMLLGAVCGGLIGITLYNLIFFSTDSFYLLVFTVLILGAAGAFLSFKYYDLIVILSTSMVGAYAFVRGISLFAGHFPNEMELIQKLANGVETPVPYQFYLYIAGIIALFGLGTFYQLREKKRGEMENFTLQK